MLEILKRMINSTDAEERIRTKVNELVAAFNGFSAVGGDVPAGGSTGQVLKKASSADYDTQWANDNTGGGGGGSTAWGSITGSLSAQTDLVATLNGKANTSSLASISTSGNSDDLTQGSTKLLMTSAERTKLSGIATGATANQTNAYLLSRANHTGTQAASTITGLATVATTGSYGDLSGTPAAYTLPTASETVLGGVKVGEGLAIDGDGVLAATSGASASVFQSDDQTITTAGSLTISHSLGSVPDLVTVWLKCTTAEQGYSVGDIVQVGPYAMTAPRGVGLEWSTSNVEVRYGNQASSVFQGIHKTTGAAAAFSNANWVMYLVAVKF